MMRSDLVRLVVRALRADCGVTYSTDLARAVVRRDGPVTSARQLAGLVASAKAAGLIYTTGSPTPGRVVWALTEEGERLAE